MFDIIAAEMVIGAVCVLMYALGVMLCSGKWMFPSKRMKEIVDKAVWVYAIITTILTMMLIAYFFI